MEKSSSAMSIVMDDDGERPDLEREVSKELMALDNDSDDEKKSESDETSSKKKKRRKSPTISRSSTVDMMVDSDDEDDKSNALSSKKAKGEPGSSGANYLFYSGQIRSKPMGNYIHEIHRLWFYNYDLLESHHGYAEAQK
jgi:hypothetical protein